MDAISDWGEVVMGRQHNIGHSCTVMIKFKIPINTNAPIYTDNKSPVFVNLTG